MVIAAEATTYADVLNGWLAEPQEHHDVLVRGYGGLQPGIHLDAGLEPATRFIEASIERFTAGPEAEREVSAAPGERSHLDDLGFCPRLWDGPLRVLLQERDASG